MPAGLTVCRYYGRRASLKTEVTRKYVHVHIMGKEMFVFRKFGVLCFLVTFVLRFAFLPNYRRIYTFLHSFVSGYWSLALLVNEGNVSVIWVQFLFSGLSAYDSIWSRFSERILISFSVICSSSEQNLSLAFLIVPSTSSTLLSTFLFRLVLSFP